MRTRIPVLLLLLSAALWAGTVERVDAVGMTVSDLDHSIAFYTEVLHFKVVEGAERSGEAYDRLQGVFASRSRVARLKLGDEFIELTEYLTPGGRPAPLDSKSNDLWFQHVAIIVSDMDRAYKHLREHDVKHISPGPQRLPDWNPNAGGIEAFYFRDPDNHALEILAFPPGKGAEKWHRDTNELFLGIDHTAIAVSDTERSLAFFRDVLGFRVAGESENYGPEQERLNHVFGARLRITAIRADGGPGIEFLEYLTPRTGRPMPHDAKANDLFHWQTRLITSDIDELSADLREARTTFVSPGIVELPEGHRGFLVRGPDGHAFEIAQ